MIWFKKKHTDIEIIKTIDKEQTNWNEEAVLFYLHNGKGSLKYEYGKAENGDLKAFMLLNEVPLIKWHSDENNCPTCQKLLSAGYGLNQVDNTIADIIKNASNDRDLPLGETLEMVKSLIELMNNGLYALGFFNLFPTDGDKRFFWDMDIVPRYYSGSCNIYHKFIYHQGYPAFILPTQPSSKFNNKRVQYYREVIKAGENVGGIAYYLDGYLCALLDGHHRATACLLEGVPFRCLTILPTRAWGYDVDNKNDFVVIGGQQINVSSLGKKLQSKILEDKQRAISSSCYLSKAKVEYYLSLINYDWNSKEWPAEIVSKARSYPSCLDLAAINQAGDLSDKRLSDLFSAPISSNEDEYEVVLRALIALQDKRAVDFALRIAKAPGLVSLWKDVFLFLSSVKSQEVEDFFIQFLVYDEKLRPEITRIATEYFNDNGNKI